VGSSESFVARCIVAHAVEDVENAIDTLDHRRLTMASLWERIRALEGQRLSTEGGRAEFDIRKVDDGFVLVMPRNTGKPRRIQRSEFEAVEAAGLARASVTKDQILSMDVEVAKFNLSYVPPIIRAALRRVLV
jgi:hypothetical protein